MDKKSKFKQFLKGEGFYVILFACLIAIGAVAFITTNNDKNDVAGNIQQVEENKKEENQKLEDKNQDKNTGNETSAEPKDPSDALQVKENELKPVPEIQVQKEQETKSVSKATNTEAVNPVKGSLVRNYTEDPVYMASTKDYRPHFGMDIKVDNGSPVISIMDGVVKNVDTSTEGTYVEIDHQNGLTTRYCNLEEKVPVKKGDKVKASQEIGKVGNTTTFAYEEYGTHLHFEVLKDGENVDPAKYVNYKK